MKKKSVIKKVMVRFFISLLTFILCAFISLWAVCYTFARGPSETARNILVLSALQASATKWIPELFLDKETVSQILSDSKIVNVDEIGLDEYSQTVHKQVDVMENFSESEKDPNNVNNTGFKDGIRLDILSCSSYKAYVMLISDPSRISVATSGEYGDDKSGINIFDLAKRDNITAAINGGEFADEGGMGTGGQPVGLTYSNGRNVWNDGQLRTFIGFDSENRLIVSEGMTKEKADRLKIRDAVSFQTGNILIEQGSDSVKLHYNQYNYGVAQRTAIGQCADGTVIFIVTDGRSASSLGANHNDIVDLMKQYGAVNAAMLDGGSSTMMYCRNYAELFGLDDSEFDSYQQRGLVNKYKAFSYPRRIPTYFAVK